MELAERPMFEQRVRNAFAQYNLHMHVEVREILPIADKLYMVETILDHGYRSRSLAIDTGHEILLYLELWTIRALAIDPIREEVKKALDAYSREHPWLLGV